ncbi:hypothetical protein AWN76_009865 [Rhodothermaceae bacterium RA]|nr:hypothetical protein AWN76_009865 [Rhodothermaceae bacterium RA]
MAAVVLGLIRLQDLSRRGGWRQVMRLRALATLFAAATVIALAVSIGVHAVYDHGPTSRDPMSPLTFVLEHPQFLFPWPWPSWRCCSCRRGWTEERPATGLQTPAPYMPDGIQTFLTCTA